MVNNIQDLCRVHVPDYTGNTSEKQDVTHIEVPWGHFRQ